MRLHDGRDDDELDRILAAQDGDPSARAWLIDKWSGPVYRFCRRMLCHDQDGHDAAQDTMVKVLRNLHRYDPGRPFATWVFQIARNTCIDEHRRRRRRPSREAKEIADDGNPSPLQIAARQQRAEMLEEALQDLPPMYREVIVLYHFEHKKYTEIAEVLDLPMGTVMNRLFRARKKLRLAYEERGGDAP